MLRGKRAVITGGGGGFGQALCVWLAREGVEVDFSARRAVDIQKTCSLIAAEGGEAKGYLCDLALPESISQFSSQVLHSDRPIDILILNAARDNRRTFEHRNLQYRQFRPDRFNPANPGNASGFKTLRQCRHHCSYLCVRYSELYRFDCPSRFFCQQTRAQRLYNETVRTLIQRKHSGNRIISA